MTYLETIDLWTAKPPGPGKFLADLLSKIDITQEEFADAIGTSRFTVNQIVNGKRTVTTAMAFRIAKATNTSPEVWLNLQRDVDAFEAYSKIKDELEGVRVVRPKRTEAEMVVALD
ncbi:HigA family addiction module antitoxin [Pararhizobium sp. BT-229]|uniref:HigA family addiction module antitoxin n=1 Tax=Pararhizobium sp. BT-229 TaxID=2986923 RepID=UPI0021F74648|nr:HigA family addiction module antitoxin [Pararhizobium sp. BT-229]MCV9964481.1 HigA family addiction module antitoxin [Pararhizobium sp. BT-229]